MEAVQILKLAIMKKFRIWERRFYYVYFFDRDRVLHCAREIECGPFEMQREIDYESGHPDDLGFGYPSFCTTLETSNSDGAGIRANFCRAFSATEAG